MMKPVLTALFAGGCLMTLPAVAATPPVAAGVPSGASEKPAQTGVIQIGDHFCPAVPDSAVSDRMKETLSLVSTTCVMEASGLITHDEAQSVYEQALGNIQMALAAIQSDATAPALASK